MPHQSRFIRLVRASAAVAAVALVTAQAAFADASRQAPPRSRPDPPCVAPALPAPVAGRFTQLGGIERFGCFVGAQGPVFIFRSGRIEAIPVYGPNATYAAIVDASDVVHLYLEGTSGQYQYDKWLVRLSYEGSLVNQVQYTSGNGDVGGTYASNILVHPGGRHGTFDIAMEGCYSGALAASVCVGWGSAVFTMNL